MATLDPRVRAQIIALRASGISFNRIAAVLNQHGVSSVQGGRWYGASIHRIVAAPGSQAKPRRNQVSTSE